MRVNDGYSGTSGIDMAQPERRYDVTPVTRAGAYRASTRRCIGGSGVCKRAGSGGRVGTLVMNMAGFAVAVAVLTSCAGGGTIEEPVPPSRSASPLPTPTLSLPTPTRSAPRPETPRPTQTKPSPALSSTRPTEGSTPPQESTRTPSATKNPSRSPISAETTATQQSLQRPVRRLSPGR